MNKNVEVEGVSRREKEPSYFWFKLVSVFLLLFAFTGLLGALGFSIGKVIYSLFVVVMGSLVWVGPFLCLIVAILLWISPPILTGNRKKILSDNKIASQSEKSRFEPDIFSKGISLPPAKLVSLQGFDHYFSSPDMVEMEDSDVQRAEEMKEIGRDFPSYFGTGESLYLPCPKIRRKISPYFLHLFCSLDIGILHLY